MAKRAVEVGLKDMSALRTRGPGGGLGGRGVSESLLFGLRAICG